MAQSVSFPENLGVFKILCSRGNVRWKDAHTHGHMHEQPRKNIMYKNLNHPVDTIRGLAVEIINLSVCTCSTGSTPRSIHHFEACF